MASVSRKHLARTDAIAAPSIPKSNTKIKMGSRMALTAPPSNVVNIASLASPTALIAADMTMPAENRGSDGISICK